MSYSIFNVCAAVVLTFTEAKIDTPNRYTEGEWNAIADVLDVLLAVGEEAEKVIRV